MDEVLCLRAEYQAIHHKKSSAPCNQEHALEIRWKWNMGTIPTGIQKYFKDCAFWGVRPYKERRIPYTYR